MWDKDMKLCYTNALFVITGAIPYYLFATVATVVIKHFCDTEIPQPASPCGVALIVMIVVAILGMPIGFLQFYRTGKWIWVDLLHVFAPAS